MKAEFITIKKYKMLWDTLIKTTDGLIKSLSEPEAQKATEFIGIMQSIIDWQMLLDINEKLEELIKKPEADSVEVIAKRMEEVNKSILQLDPMVKNMESSYKEAYKKFNTLGKNQELLGYCSSLMLIVKMVFEGIVEIKKLMSNTLQQLQEIIKSPPPESSVVDIPEMTAREKSDVLDTILDEYSKGRITKDQMKERFLEFAKNNPLRTITSFGKITL